MPDSEAEYVPFIAREEGKEYKCNICLDYGGLLESSGKTWPDGEPLTKFCECRLPQPNDD
jgi:hypothetical protein